MPKRFNLSQIIETYNFNYQKRVDINKTWGLYYLEPENLGFLFDADRLLNELLKAPTAVNKSRAIQILYRKGKIGAALVARFNWEQSLNRLFVKESFWLQLMQETAAQNKLRLRRLRALQELWQIPLLHLHGNEALAHLILVIKTVLVHLRLAKKELSTSTRIPEPIHECYQHYLSKLEKHFIKARQQVTKTMFFRLLAANVSVQKTGNYYGDAISYTFERLQQDNIVLKSTELSGYRHLFTAHTFQVFNQTVEQYGGSTLRQQQRNFFWLRDNASGFQTTTVTIGQQYCLVPRVLTPYVPAWRGWPKWLFKDRHARAEFFIEEQFNFAQLKIPLPDLPNPLTINAEQSYLQIISELESIAKQALQNLQAKKMTWREYSFKELLAKWKQLNEERLNACAEKRLILLETIGLQAVSDDLQTRTKRWQFARSLIKQLESHNLSLAFQVRLGALSKKLQQNLGQHPFTFAGDLLLDLANGNSLKLKDREHLLKVLVMLDLGEFSLADITTSETAKLAAQQLFSCVKRLFQVELIPFKELLVNCRLVQHLGNDGLKQRLQLLLEEKILRHFERLLLMPESSAKKDAEEFEQLVIQIANEEWQAFFKKLKIIRLEKPWLSYLTAYRVEAERLALAYTDQMVEAEANRIEQYFERLISDFTQNEAEFRVLSELPKKLITAQKEDLNAVALAPYEKVLAGLQGASERRPIKLAAEAAAVAKMTTHKIKSTKSLLKKEKLLDQLQTDIRYRLSNTTFFQKRYRVSTLTTSLEGIHHDFARARI